MMLVQEGYYAQKQIFIVFQNSIASVFIHLIKFIICIYTYTHASIPLLSLSMLLFGCLHMLSATSRALSTAFVHSLYIGLMISCIFHCA